MQLDLRHDAATIANLLRCRIDAHAARVTRYPAAPRVSAVVLGYAFDQRGWLVIHFDERPIHHPDGKWTLHIDRHLVDFPHWHEAYQSSAAGDAVTLLNANGTVQEVPAGLTWDAASKVFAWALGITLRDVALNALRERAFDRLPKQPPCPLTVHEFEGTWDWPPAEMDEILLA